MYDFVPVLALLAAVWVLAVPILLILYFKLGSRVKDLTREVQLLGERLSNASPSARTDAPRKAMPAEAANPPEIKSSGAVPPPLKPQPPVKAVQSKSVQDASDIPPKAFVFRQDKITQAFRWLKENWVLAAGAASLSLAGIFLVQYGAERGLLTPVWRVIAAIVTGILLLAGGEFIRRRFGDDRANAAQFLPSALSGAGLITLFAAVLSARVLYDLIGPGQAFAGLVVVSAVGVVFGWFYGPVLTAVSILGATAAPYLIGGSSDSAWILQYYFALIALTGLAIDTLKRWAWVSVLTLLGTGVSMWLAFIGTQESLHFIVGVLVVAVGAILIPQRSLQPNHTGAPVVGLFGGQRPEFPTRLSFGATFNAGLAALGVTIIGFNLADVHLGIFALTLLMLATTVWMQQADALVDHPIIPNVLFLGVIISQSILWGPLYEAFIAGTSRLPETAPPQAVWLLLVVAVLSSALIFWRMPRARMPLIWALAAASYAPVAVFLLEFLWDPSRVYGAYPWALAVMAVAALMTVWAERSVRYGLADGALIASLFATAALSLIGLALFLMLTKTALTLALAMMVLLVTMLDRRFNLPLLTYYIMIGVAVISYRLVVDPGIVWAVDDRNSLFQVILAYAGSIAILAIAQNVTHDQRPRLVAVLESAVWVLGAAFVFVLFVRLLPGRGVETHWGLGLLAAVWATMAFAQLYRLKGSSKIEGVFRKALLGFFALIAVLTIILRFTNYNPLASGETIIGVPLFSTLALAYLPVSIVLGLAGWKLVDLARKIRIALLGIGAGYLMLYILLSIRHFWRGPDLSVIGFSDAELYSYTVAMLLASAATLMIAFWQRAVWLRKLALAGIGLTIAKVFVVDMAGLGGLFRVVSFMGLGLGLLALTWLDRMMSAQWEKTGGQE